jgi:hypothetical protein
MSAYVDLLSITGTAAPGSSISDCLAQFYLGDVFGTIQPAATYTQPTDGFQVVSYDATLVFITTTYITPAEEELGLIMSPQVNPTFGIGVQCPPGVSGTFVLDNISMCDVNGLCASLV